MVKIERSDYEVKVLCRCAPSHSNFHGPKGCEHNVTAFYWNRRTQSYDIVNRPCRCAVAKVTKDE
jgi:hypothetical protein